MNLTRKDCVALDRTDALASHRERFALPDGVIYLCGNSLGAQPRAAAARLREVVEQEWGQGLTRSWNTARWTEAPRRLGAKIAALIGARPDEVVCADSTSINLFKLLAAALRLQSARPQVSPTAARRVVLSERSNFPSDLYMAEGLLDLLGGHHELRLVDSHQIAAAMDESTSVVLLTHVNYQTGAMFDLADLTRRAHDAGSLLVWDLAHSAGAVPIDLNAAGADLAVGCGYKYLNGGPGAPSFLFAAARLQAALAEDPFAQPLAGWFGHRTPFAFAPQYRPAPGIDRFVVGTPSILSLAALEVGVDTVLDAGIEQLRNKSIRLTELLIGLATSRCREFGLELASPREFARRGSQVCFTHEHAWPLAQALSARGVIGDFRAPNILRFGIAPLYLRFVDVWDAADMLHRILAERGWDRAEFQEARAVT